MMPGTLMTGISGPELTAEEREWLAHPRAAGVILFERNIHDWQQLCALTEAVHAAGGEDMLVAVDQEGGRVQRVRGPCTRLPPVRRLGDRHDRNAADALAASEATGWLMAAELRAAGIDISFAPVLDLDRGVSSVIGDRALHGDPDVVAALADAWIRGMAAAGMAACGKHFPGHGGVVADSHFDLPVDDRPELALRGEDMVPFERLMDDGRLAAVMTAHVVYAHVDNQAATFSPTWIHRTLREELGFRGVVVGDDLGMEGAASIGGFPARAEAAVHAGCDLLLLCNELDAVGRVLESLGADGAEAARDRLRPLHPGAQPALDLAALQGTDSWRDARRRADALAERAPGEAGDA